MGFRFFKRIKLFPGLTLNLSKSGGSFSFGGRGAKVTVGPKGTRTTVGLPGTGIFYTRTSSSKTSSSPKSSAALPQPPATTSGYKMPYVIFYKKYFPLMRWWIAYLAFVPFSLIMLATGVPDAPDVGMAPKFLGAVAGAFALYCFVAVPAFYVKCHTMRREREATTFLEQDAASKERLTVLSDEVRKFCDSVNIEGKIPTITSSLMLKPGENAYLEAIVRLMEKRKDGIAELDSGKLVLTNTRLIFDGTIYTRTFPLDDILSVQQYSDGVELAIDSKSKSQFFADLDNPYLWKVLITYVRQIPVSGELPKIDLHIDI